MAKVSSTAVFIAGVDSKIIKYEMIESNEYDNICESATSVNETPFAYTLSLISGKYKMSILYCLFRKKIVRYNEMKRYLSGISFKSLTHALRELENDNLIVRKEFHQIPPKVEYRLSKRGKSLIPILDLMCHWGKENYKRYKR